MVEMAVIRKERFTGVPLLLGADTLTGGRDGNPINGPRTEGIPDRPRFSYPPPVQR
jgi:hypothetical protein